MVELLFVVAGLRPVFFLCYDYNKFGAVSQISTFRDMNDTNFVEKFSYNSDGRVKQYVKRFFGELLNIGEIMQKNIILFCFITILVNSSCSDYQDDLSDGYKFISESNDFEFIDGYNLVLPKVICYSKDSLHIICAQKYLNRSIFLFNDTIKKNNQIFLKSDSEVNIDKMDKIESILLKNSINFYIIDKKSHSIKGPLDLNEFIRLKDSLKINLKLKLDI